MRIGVRTLLPLLLLSSGLPTLGCGEGDSAELAIAEQPLQGQIAGQQWFIGGATSKDDVNRSTSEILWTEVHLSEEPICGRVGDDGPGMIIPMPRVPGTYPLDGTGPSRATFTFEDESGEAQNHFSTDGFLVVEDITADSATASIITSSNEGDFVEGRFTSVICPRQ